MSMTESWMSTEFGILIAAKEVVDLIIGDTKVNSTSSLVTIHIPNSITRISSRAFFGSSLVKGNLWMVLRCFSSRSRLVHPLLASYYDLHAAAAAHFGFDA